MYLKSHLDGTLLIKGVVSGLKYPPNGVWVVNSILEVPYGWDFIVKEFYQWIEVPPEWDFQGCSIGWRVILK